MYTILYPVTPVFDGEDIIVFGPNNPARSTLSKTGLAINIELFACHNNEVVNVTLRKIADYSVLACSIAISADRTLYTKM